MNRLAWLLFLALPLSGRSGEIPVAVLPSGVGVNIHFVAGHDQDLDLIAAAGFKVVRMDFSWQGTEPQKGQFDWSNYDMLIIGLEKRGLRPLFILDYSHPLYEETVESKNPINGELHKNTASPQHPESVAAFARWAAAAVRHYRGRHVIWEIWNEPNIQFWSPKPDVSQYSALALAAAKAIRETDPEATLIAPATSGFPWEFLETVFKNGLLEFLDGVSVHPYRDYRQPPESAAADYQKLRELINQHAPEAKKGKIAVLSGEWGYATHDRGLPLDTQAAFAVRQQLANLLHGVPLSIWYDWKNDGPDPKEREHNFGVVFADLKPKPAYTAIQTLTRELNGYRIRKRVPLPADQDYVLLMENSSGALKLVSWTLGAPHTVRLDIDLKNGDSLRVVSGLNDIRTQVINAGQLPIELTTMPHYITLGTATLK
jgi:hypothetical protein